jgi:hypothetical protein
MMATMRLRALFSSALVLSLLGCGKSVQSVPLEQGIRGQVPVDKDSWAPAPGETICASEHEQSNDPPCARIGRNGSFELSVKAGTYWLCGQSGRSLSCRSLCPHTVKPGEVTEVDPSDFLPLLPEGQGFYGTSTGSFGEHGYLDVAHPLRVCVGPPDTPLRTPTAKLTCAETDRCGRYVLSVPAGSYRVLFAEHGEDITSDRQRCRYDLSAGQAIEIHRMTGRGAPNEPAECPEGSTPDPLTELQIDHEQLLPLLDTNE